MTASNPLIRQTAIMLARAGKEEKVSIWADVSRILMGPGLNSVEVNVGRLARVATGSVAVIVPGKVLGGGIIDKEITVGAFSFSEAARSKISAAGGSAITLEQLVKKFPKGKGVKIVK